MREQQFFPDTKVTLEPVSKKNVYFSTQKYNSIKASKNHLINHDSINTLLFID